MKDDNNFAAFTSSEDFLASNECSSHPEALVGTSILNKVGKCPQLCIIFEKMYSLFDYKPVFSVSQCICYPKLLAIALRLSVRQSFEMKKTLAFV